LHISLLYLLFINNFDIYQNIYCTLKAFYLILAYLFYKKRQKITNVFIFILESYKTKLKTIVKIFFKLIKQLNRNIINLKINKKSISIYVFAIKLIEDIS